MWHNQKNINMKNHKKIIFFLLFIWAFPNIGFCQDTHLHLDQRPSITIISYIQDKSMQTPNPEKFSVFVNGQQKIDTSNINTPHLTTVKKLLGGFWKVKIVFEDKNIPAIIKNVYLRNNFYKHLDDKEIVLELKKNKKGKYTLSRTKNKISNTLQIISEPLLWGWR